MAPSGKARCALRQRFAHHANGWSFRLDGAYFEGGTADAEEWMNPRPRRHRHAHDRGDDAGDIDVGALVRAARQAQA